MKSYIDFNTRKRTKSNNEPDKNFLKLINNAVYAKTMANMIKRMKIRFVKSKDDFIKIHEYPHVLIGKYLKKN